MCKFFNSYEESLHLGMYKLKICKKLRCLNEIKMEFQTFFPSSENHSRVFRRCTNSCQCPKFPSRLMYLQFVFPSRVVSGGAGSLSAYVYFPTTRRSESDRRGGGGNRGPWEEQDDG